MIRTFGFWILLIACGVAFEMYDESRPFGIDQNEDVTYNEDTYDYPDLVPYRPVISEDPVQEMMLYQLFNSLQNSRNDVGLRMHYRPKFSMGNSPMASYGHVPYSDLMGFKAAVAKRNSNASGGAPAMANTDRHNENPNDQKPKPKGKNVRKLANWVCYFKPCSFFRPGQVHSNKHTTF